MKILPAPASPPVPRLALGDSILDEIPSINPFAIIVLSIGSSVCVKLKGHNLGSAKVPIKVMITKNVLICTSILVTSSQLLNICKLVVDTIR